MYTPRQNVECPLFKRDYFNSKYIWTNQGFSGAVLNFRVVSQTYPKWRMFSTNFHWSLSLHHGADWFRNPTTMLIGSGIRRAPVDVVKFLWFTTWYILHIHGYISTAFRMAFASPSNRTPKIDLKKFSPAYNSENHESWKQIPFHKNKDTLVFQIPSQKVFWVGFWGPNTSSKGLGCGPLPSNSDHKDYFIFSRESL